MKNDPFTLTIALSSTSESTTVAKGDLYMDDGETYAHTQGDLIWRGFTTTRTSSGGKTRSSPKKTSYLISSRDLVEPALGRGEPIVESSNTLTAPSTLTLGRYDPEGNAFAKGIADVVFVERIVLLGLESKPVSVRGGKGGGRDIEFEWFEGASSEEAKKNKKKVASKLVIKNPKVSIVTNWDITITL